MTPNSDRHHSYAERRDAGIILAARLGHLKGRRNVVLIALPHVAPAMGAP
jgi:predicted phosphoribosyltransferase